MMTYDPLARLRRGLLVALASSLWSFGCGAENGCPMDREDACEEGSSFCTDDAPGSFRVCRSGGDVCPSYWVYRGCPEAKPLCVAVDRGSIACKAWSSSYAGGPDPPADPRHSARFLGTSWRATC